MTRLRDIFNTDNEAFMTNTISKLGERQKDISANCCGGFFFLIDVPKELYELSADDMELFTLYEFEAALSVKFNADSSGLYRAKLDETKDGIVDVFIDLSGSLNGIFIFGKYLTVKRYTEKISKLSQIDVIPLNNDSLLGIVGRYAQITKFSHEFVRDNYRTGMSNRFSGTVEGEAAHDSFWSTHKLHPALFCLKAVTGFLDMSSIATLGVYNNGVFIVQDFDHASLVSNLNAVSDVVRHKTTRILERHVFTVDKLTGGDYAVIGGTGLLYDVYPARADLSVFYEKLSRSELTLNGRICLLKSLQLDRLYRIISYKNGAAIELALNPEIVQVNLHNAGSIFPALCFEYFMQKHLYAGLKFYEV